MTTGDFWLDFLYVGGNLSNNFYNYHESQFNFSCVLSMLIVLVLNLIKTLFYLRIFQKFSPLVMMMQGVVVDLLEFLLFFLVLIFFFAQMIGVLGH